MEWSDDYLLFKLIYSLDKFNDIDDAESFSDNTIPPLFSANRQSLSVIKPVSCQSIYLSTSITPSVLTPTMYSTSLGYQSGLLWFGMLDPFSIFVNTGVLIGAFSSSSFCNPVTSLTTWLFPTSDFTSMLARGSVPLNTNFGVDSSISIDVLPWLYRSVGVQMRVPTLRH